MLFSYLWLIWKPSIRFQFLNVVIVDILWTTALQPQPLFWGWKANKDFYFPRWWRDNENHSHAYQMERGQSKSKYMFVYFLNCHSLGLFFNYVSQWWRVCQMEWITRRKETSVHYLKRGIFHRSMLKKSWRHDLNFSSHLSNDSIFDSLFQFLYLV